MNNWKLKSEEKVSGVPGWLGSRVHDSESHDCEFEPHV